jgi:zinc transport system substrate-binding protein
MVRLLVALLVFLAGCQQASGPAPDPPKPLVVTTIYPLYEFARQVAGDRAEVVSLIPPGIEPHHWEPAPAEIVRVQGARVLVYNGAGLEGWIDRLLAGLPEATVVVESTAGLPLAQADLPQRHGGHGHDHGATAARKAETAVAPVGVPDPHVWLDPVLAQAQVEAIRAALVRAEPAHADAFDDNARRFTARLAALHDAYEAGLAQCGRRDIVVSHAAFTYLARRYGLLQVPIALNPESEPTPADLAAAVRFARRHKVKYVFFETLVSARVAETLAREVGAQTLVLNPIEGLRPEEAAAGKSYVELMEENLENLRTALECR